jgi:hypothetical protein
VLYTAHKYFPLVSGTGGQSMPPLNVEANKICLLSFKK